MQRIASKVLWPVAVIVAAVSCGGGVVDGELAVGKGAAAGVETVVPTAAGGDHTEVADVAFLTFGGVDYRFDIRIPADRGAAEGARPVVVLFHGFSAAGNDAADAVDLAVAAANAGMVVFTPGWIVGDPFPLLLDDVELQQVIGNCAIAVAQQRAVEFGGDPARTVTAGFSAGTGPALIAALSREAPVDGCVESSPPLPIVGALLGDGEYFWQSEPFDGAFDQDLEPMRDDTQRRVDPTLWPVDPSVQLRVWAAADGTAPRVIDPAASNGDWLSSRDPDGSLRGDLSDVGALDDGSVDYLDNARLLTHRAVAAGVDTEFIVFPGGHTTDDKIPELVTLLMSAAAES